MGFLDKVKNLFTEPEDEFDDEEIEIEQINKEKPVKEKTIKEKMVVEKPVVEKKREKIIDEEETREFVEPELDIEVEKEEVKEDYVEPVSQPKTRESMKTPIFFTENDFADLEPERPKKVEKKREIVDYRTSIKKEDKKQPYGGAFSSTTILTTEKQTFKPTPIISPIWGVLDKNYSKEDIVERNEEREGGKSKMDKFDQVRNKAYGRLENDLEDTIYSAPKESSKKIKVEEEIDLFDELESESLKKETKKTTVDDYKSVDLSRNVREQENNIKDLEETTMDLTKELDNLLLQRETYSEKKKKIENETSKEDLMTENELFNIIDSIYEEGKE